MNEPTNNNVISVKELNNCIKFLFDNTPILHNIAVHGEISNYTGVNRSGHIYFSLKDEDSIIRAVMFKYDTFSLTFEPKNGDEVILYGSVSTYAPSGTYQIIVKKIQLYGEGEILLKKKKLIEKLQKEGLFDESHKLPLPEYPRKIALITGKNSAACVDILTNINRRFPLVDINVFYSLVQGNDAAKDLMKSLKLAEQSNPDVIIIGRGGGSSEDLSAFDDEDLAREIYNLKIPVISAVGHEINRSICDYVADKYVSTPTGAAEAAVPDKMEIIQNLNATYDLIKSIVNRKISYLENKLNLLKSNPNLTNLNNVYSHIEENIKHKKSDLNIKMLNILKIEENKILSINTLINAINPNNLLKKGYSIIYKDNKIIKSINDVNLDDSLTIKLYDGTIETNVKEIKND